MDPAIDSSLSTPPPPPPAFMQPEPPVISVVPQAEQPKKPSKKKLALVIASILVLLGSIGGGVILVRMRSQPQISAAACDDNERWAHITADWLTENGARVTNSSTSCTYDISLASYSFYAWSDQTLFDHAYLQVGPGQSIDIKVNMPNCKAQLDLFFGTEPVPANHSFPDYANKGLIKWKHVGETNCSVGPSATPTVPAGPSATPTPTTPVSQAPSCPAGTTRLFSTAGVNLSVGSVVGGNGRITAANGSWNTESRNGVVLARGGFDMTVTFPISTTLTTALIYDNDPNSGETGWSINGVTLPTTANETWGPAFTLNITTTTLNFLNGDDSPHFNVCFRQTTPSATPTPTPTPVVTVTPGPSATPTPTVTPGPSPTPGPSSTPTPGPSATPGPSSTPGPTATRTPNTPTPVTELPSSGSIAQTWLTIITGLGILGFGLLLAL